MNSAPLPIGLLCCALIRLPDALAGGMPQVIVNGTLSGVNGELLWTPESGPYRIEGGNAEAPIGLHLRILAGCEVQVEKGRSLIINGSLSVEGSDASHVVFRGVPGAPLEADPASDGLPQAPPKWGGVQFVDTLSAENWISYAEVHDAQTMAGSIGLVRSHATIDHCTFSGTHWRVVYSNASAPTVQYCTFSDTFGPDESAVALGIDNVAEHIKAVGAIPAGHRFLIYRNIFGTNKGHNDVIDVDSGIRPAPRVEIRENYFAGCGDELADLGGDVLLEGNFFQHIRKDPAMSNGVYANAISTGDPGNPAATIVCVRNVFWDVDHSVSCRVGTAVIFENNTVVTMHPDFTDAGGRLNTGSAIGLRAIAFNDAPGDGCYLSGNIFTDLPRVVGNADSPATRVSKIEAFDNFIDPAASFVIGARAEDLFALGTGNVTGDPLFIDAAAADFHLTAASPARGSGPFGRDFGAYVPAGAWIKGGPTGITASRDATFTIGGPGIFAFKWRLNNAPWSADIPIGEWLFSRTNPTVRTAELPLTGLADGTYTLAVIGQDFAGIWQDEAASALSQTWTVCNPRPLFASLHVDPDSDDDGDGVSAFGEYAFGLSATAADSVPLTSRFTPSGEWEVQCLLPDACPPPLVAPPDVLYSVQFSPDLITWSEASHLDPGANTPTGNATLSAASGGYRTLTVSLPSSPGTHWFIRVVAKWRPAE